MLGALAVAFLVVPLLELAIVVQVSEGIGLGPTLVLLVLDSVVGAWLVKREGLGVWGRVRGQLDRGQLPGREVVDAALILFGGALLLTPGFLTDALGLSLMLPPVRAGIRRLGVARLRHRVEATVGGAGVYEVRSAEVRERGERGER